MNLDFDKYYERQGCEDVSPERSELRSRLNAGCAEIIPDLLESIRKATSERREYGKGNVAK